MQTTLRPRQVQPTDGVQPLGRWRVRLTSVAAGTYVGAWLIGLLIAPTAPPVDAAPGEIVSLHLESAAAVVASSVLVHGVAGVAIAVFSVSVASATAVRGSLRRTVIGTGLAAATSSLVQVALAVTAVASAGRRPALAVDLFTSVILVDVLKITLLAGFVAVATAAVVRAGRNPRWLPSAAALLVASLLAGTAALLAPRALLDAVLAASLVGLLAWTTAVAVSLRDRA